MAYLSRHRRRGHPCSPASSTSATSRGRTHRGSRAVRARTARSSGDEVKLRNGKPVKEEILARRHAGTTAVTGKDDDLSPIRTARRRPVRRLRLPLLARSSTPARPSRQRTGFQGGGIGLGRRLPDPLVGWSAGTENPAAAEKAGFTVVDGRIVLPLAGGQGQLCPAQSRRGGNTNPAKDVEITIRRPGPADKAYEQRADEVFLDAPWKKVAVGVGGVSAANDPADDEPFLDVVQGYRSFPQHERSGAVALTPARRCRPPVLANVEQAGGCVVTPTA